MIKSSYKKGLAVIAVLLVSAFLLREVGKNPEQSKPSGNQHFEIISTNPDPLEGATILSNQYIEITFSKPLVASEFKHKFDPDIEYKVEVLNSQKDKGGTTVRITFKNLELGSGYTLFVLPQTKTEESEELGKDYIYHFKTINYKGV